MRGLGLAISGIGIACKLTSASIGTPCRRCAAERRHARAVRQLLRDRARRGSGPSRAARLVDRDPRRHARRDLERRGRAPRSRRRRSTDTAARASRDRRRARGRTAPRSPRLPSPRSARHRDALLPRLARELAAHDELAALGAQRERRDERRALEHVGDAARARARTSALPAISTFVSSGARVRSSRRFAPRSASSSRPTSTSAPRPARAQRRRERAIHRRADAEHVQAARASAACACSASHDLLLAADVAVGDDHDLALRSGAQRLHAPRASPARISVPPLASRERTQLIAAALRRARSPRRLARVAASARRELDQLEAIVLAERVDHQRDDLLRLVERTAAHRAARVEEHDQIARHRRRLRGRRGGTIVSRPYAPSRRRARRARARRPAVGVATGQRTTMSRSSRAQRRARSCRRRARARATATPARAAVDRVADRDLELRCAADSGWSVTLTCVARTSAAVSATPM